MSTTLFRDDGLCVDAAGSALLESVLMRAADRSGVLLRTADLFAALLERAAESVDSALQGALVPGARPGDLVDAIDVYAPPSETPTAFDGRREHCTPNALAALDRLEAQLADGEHAAVAAELLMSAVLRELDDDDRRGLLGILDADVAIELVERRAHTLLEPPEPLLDAATGRLRSEVLSAAAWTALEQAAAHAKRLGHDRLLPPHCLLGLLGETEGVADLVVRMEARPGVGPVEVAAVIDDGFRLAVTGAGPPQLDRHGIGDGMLAVLAAAQRQARLALHDRIESHHLLAAVLEDPPARLRSVLEGGALQLDVARMRRRAGELAQRAGDGDGDAVFRLPAGLLASEDLTHRARNGELEPALHVERHLEPALRALCRRRQNNVLLTADGGVGATSVVRELARRAAGGEIRGLARKRFLRADCALVAPEESMDKLTGVLAYVAGRTDVILCLDGLGPILRGPAGTNHKATLRAALAGGHAQVVAVVSPPDFRDLLAGDPALAAHFTRIELDEPSSDEAAEIVTRMTGALEAEHGVRIAPGAVARAVMLMADYALSERLPAKAIGALRRACEDADYARRQDAAEAGIVDEPDVVRAVAELTGIPPDQLSGVGGRVDYERALAAAVVGQPEAVRVAAAELRRINAGIVDPGRPAAVMLFAGLTGVGKTELAKAIAGLYSASRRLQTYTMANFTEAHSVSGIIGVPPGYHGHHLGGRLINDLAADPYCVFLLDEAEKAHPDVWKPFLNLFDEGWIVDQRGTKAYADRAIFILASNSGQETLGRLWRAGATPEEIARGMRDALLEERNSRTHELVFPPEFLARIGRIVVFSPLDADAMAGISRLGVERLCALWRRREKTLVVAPELVDLIASEALRLDTVARNTEGGRVVRRLVEDLVQGPVMAALDADPERAGSAEVIAVGIGATIGERTEIRVEVRPGGGDGG